MCSIGQTYLVDDGLGESLAHGVRFLRGLVGEKGSELVVERRRVRGHRFVVGVRWLWGVSRDGGRRQAKRASRGGVGAGQGGGRQRQRNSSSGYLGGGCKLLPRGVCLRVAGARDALSPAERTDSASAGATPNRASAVVAKSSRPGA